MKTVGIIPCRYASSRFPGKVLADIHGKPMVWHVYDSALKATSLDAVYVATADQPIIEACRQLGLEVVITSGRHRTGSDCVAECVDKVEAGIYVNVQGDEPMISPWSIDRVVSALGRSSDERIVASNAYDYIGEPCHVLDVNVVKVTLAKDETALAFSRYPIPYPKQGMVGRLPVRYRRQVGLYAFTPAGLRFFTRGSQLETECAEQIEMLRILEHGGKVAMTEVDEDVTSVDTESDLRRIRALMLAPK